MSNFASLTLTTATAGTALENAPIETGGPWFKHPLSSGGSMVVTTAKRLRSAIAGQDALYLATAQPATNEVEASADLYVADNGVINFVTLRVRQNPTANTAYIFLYSTGNPQLNIYRQVNGTSTLLAYASATSTPGTTRRFKLRVRNDDNGNAVLSLYADDVLVVGPFTDTSPITDKGYVAIGGYSDGSDTTGQHFDNITAADAGSTIAAMSKILKRNETIGVDVTGVETAFSGTPFTVHKSPTNDASVGTQTIYNGTSATVIVSTGATAGTITLTDAGGGATTTILVDDLVRAGDDDLADVFTPLEWRVTPTLALASSLGASMSATFTGSGLALVVDVSAFDAVSLPSDRYPVLTWTIDNAPAQHAQLTPGQLLVPIGGGLSGGSHTLELVYRAVGGMTDYGLSRWIDSDGLGQPYALRVVGVVTTSGGTIVGTTPDLTLRLGDSIWECNYSAPDQPIITIDPRSGFSYGLPKLLGTRGVALTYAGTGYLAGALDNVPAVGVNWRNFDSVHARPIATYAARVKFVMVGHGTNDRSSDQTNVQTAATALYNDLLDNFTAATVYVVIPLGQFCKTALAAAVASVNSPRLRLVDLGDDYATGLTDAGPSYQSSDGIHPNGRTHAILGQAVVAAMFPSGRNGTGSNATTLTITDGTSPLPNFQCWVTSDVDGLIPISGVQTTDSSGHVTFKLNASTTYFLRGHGVGHQIGGTISVPAVTFEA